MATAERAVCATRPVRTPSRGGKRAFDVVVAGFALLVLAPVFAVVAVLIKLDSRGSVFFRQTRVGRHGRPFRMWKFRKMRDDLTVQGPSLTSRHDPRLTRLGRFLERTKLDELPQLLNVLAGDMSLVGPRPEVPRFVDHYPEQWNEVLSVRPGVVGPAQLRFRNESELYPEGCRDMEAYYIAHILPPKLAIDAAYARQASLLGDLFILTRTVFVAFGGIITRKSLVTRRWQIMNAVILSALGVAGTALCGRLAGSRWDGDTFFWALVFSAVAKPACIIGFRVPKSLATSVTADDLVRCVSCAAVSGSLIVSALVFSGYRDVGRAVLAADTGLFLISLILYKLFCYQAYLTFILQQARELSRRLIVTSVVVGPLGMAVVLVARHGWAEATGPQAEPMAVLILLAAIIRPAVLVFRPLDEGWIVGAGGITLLWKLLTRIVVGSSMILAGALLFNERGVGRLDIACDGVVQFLLAVAVLSRRRHGAIDRRVAGRPEPQERLLVVGSGLQLSAYLSALAALPEQKFQIVGAVSPRAGDRSCTVAGLPLLGHVADAPQLVTLHSITRIVVLSDNADDEDLDHLRSAYPLEPERVVRVNWLGPARDGA